MYFRCLLAFRPLFNTIKLPWFTFLRCFLKWKIACFLASYVISIFLHIRYTCAKGLISWCLMWKELETKIWWTLIVWLARQYTEGSKNKRTGSHQGGALVGFGKLKNDNKKKERLVSKVGGNSETGVVCVYQRIWNTKDSIAGKSFYGNFVLEKPRSV